MKQEIEQALYPLVGLPLSALHRSRRLPGWQRFEFGPQKVSSEAVNGSSTCGLYIIHAACGWRIVEPRGIVIGAFDYSIINGEEERPRFSESDDTIRNLKGIALLRHLQQADLLVREVSADNIGGVHFSLAQGYYLDLLPMDSLPEVQWRLIERVGDTDDLVVTGAGIERTKQ